MKITLFNRKRILLKPNTTEVSGFLIGKGPKGTEKLEYIEKGSRPSESYFFFSVEYQKRYGMVLKGTDKRTVKNRKRRGLKPNTKPRKQFDIIGGREGFGIMAKWENFSPRSQGMLKSIYGKKPSWPGFEGLNIGGRLLAHIKSRGAAEDMVNTDKTVLEYINSLYKFDLSKADIVFNDLSFEPDKTVARGTAKIKQDERKLEATNRGPFSKFDEIIARVVVEMFSK